MRGLRLSPFEAPLVMRISHRIWMPLVFLTAICSPKVQVRGADANLLQNPSFEEVDEATGYPLHWASVWGKPVSCAYTLACAKHGVASALIVDPSAQESHGLRSAHVEVTPGQWYEARVYVRIAECTRGGFALYLEFWNQAKVRGEHKIASTSRQGGWRLLAVRLKAPADAATATALVYAGSVSIGKAYFDQASLKAVGPRPKATKHKKQRIEK